MKFHDISTHTAKPDRSLKTAVPVWKARYTPFGDGLATVIVPQVSSAEVATVMILQTYFTEAGQDAVA